MASRKEQKEKAREERLAAEQDAAAKAARRRRVQTFGSVAAVAIVGAIIGVAVSSSGGGSSPAPAPPRVSTTSINALGKLRAAPPPGPFGPEAVPIPPAPALASSASTATGQTVDGIQCLGNEQLLFHIHTHLTIFADGSARQVAAGVGIPGSCLYWLHTHQPDGIIHIEAPVQRTFTLGNFFDIWGQQLSSDQVGPAKGKVTAFYNGALYQGNPRDIPLGRYAQIQLDVGSPLVAPEHITFTGTGL
jgi:hypothetical protein